MSEVETFTETLTRIGRNAAKLKSLLIDLICLFIYCKK